MTFTKNDQEEIREDLFFNIMINFWVLQTLLMTIAVFLIMALSDTNPDIGSQALIFTMYLDTVVMIGFTIWGVVAIFKWKNVGGLLVAIGAFAFLIFSTSYRAIMKIYPDFGYVQTVVNILNLETPDLDPNRPFDNLFAELGKVASLFLYSNEALAVLSIGLAFFIKRRRLKVYLIAYGVLNVLIAAIPIIVILKPIVSILFLFLFHFGLYRDKYPF
ncbi:MAG: hypothetical protein D6732_10100 [Methanobacteriota archaeon]|nr:MAG: hypothetical protein D6732_10100 [Euryarchaeota archaeon]